MPFKASILFVKEKKQCFSCTFFWQVAKLWSWVTMYLYALCGTNPNSLQISYSRTEELHLKYSWHLKLAGAQRETGTLVQIYWDQQIWRDGLGLMGGYLRSTRGRIMCNFMLKNVLEISFTFFWLWCRAPGISFQFAYLGELVVKGVSCAWLETYCRIFFASLVFILMMMMMMIIIFIAHKRWWCGCTYQVPGTNLVGGTYVVWLLRMYGCIFFMIRKCWTCHLCSCIW
jgi:hypothetical protein